MTALPYEPGDRVLLDVRRLHGVEPRGKVWATVLSAMPDLGTLRLRLDTGETFAPSVDSVTCAAEEIAGLITLEVMAQLEELSDDTVGALGGLASGDDVLFNRLLEVAEDLRETLIATVDQRVADWTCDNSGAPR